MDGQIMFDKGVNALKKIFPQNESYYCPICFQEFKTYNPKTLTKEHVPAKKLGGKELLLTCAKCNNEGGFKTQSHQIERERQEDFWAGELSAFINLELKTEKGILRGELETKSNEPHVFRIQPKRNKPDTLVLNEKLIKDSKLHKIGKQYNWHSSRVADLRDAYLILFCTYGYSFIIWKFYDWIRETILNGKSTMENSKWSLFMNDPFSKEVQEKYFSPVILTTEIPNKAIIVARGTSGCLMPTMHCKNPYKDLSDDKAHISLSRTINPVSDNMGMIWDFNKKLIIKNINE